MLYNKICNFLDFIGKYEVSSRLPLFSTQCSIHYKSVASECIRGKLAMLKFIYIPDYLDIIAHIFGGNITRKIP